jgi:hypothetical protein
MSVVTFGADNTAIVELTKANLLPSGLPIIDDALHCSLTTKQKAHNTANITAAGVVGLAVTALTAGAPLAIQAATSVVPVPLDWVVPIPGKNAYYLGYVHDTSTCVAVPNGVDTRKSWTGFTRRGSAVDVDNGCFVWETLSYADANNVRVVLFGGGVWRHVFETKGKLVTWLDKEPTTGQLVFCMWDGVNTADTVGPASTRCQRVPVHHMDQVLYVSCGERPTQCKWHVRVENGRPMEVVLKRRAASTKSTGVSMPEKGAIMEAAKACGVNSDGSVLEGKRMSNSVHAWTTSTVRALDPERLNVFKNRSILGQKRMAQPANAVPWEAGRAAPTDPFLRKSK